MRDRSVFCVLTAMADKRNGKSNMEKAKEKAKTDASKVIDTQLDGKPLKKKAGSASLTSLLKICPIHPFYVAVEPMLATLVDRPLGSEDWLYVVKWDGYRALACIDGA